MTISVFDKSRRAQHDAIDAENGEIVLADVLHQTTDHQKAYDKGYHAAGDQDAQLGGGSVRSLQQEL